MKTFIKIAGILCLLSVFLTFPACGSDDDDDNDNPDNPASLIGNWFEAPTDSVTESFISFRKDGTYLWDDSKSISEGKYVVSDGEIKFYFAEELGEHGYYPYKYEFKRGQLILIDYKYMGWVSVYERTKCTSLEECMEEYDY